MSQATKSSASASAVSQAHPASIGKPLAAAEYKVGVDNPAAISQPSAEEVAAAITIQRTVRKHRSRQQSSQLSSPPLSSFKLPTSITDAYDNAKSALTNADQSTLLKVIGGIGAVVTVCVASWALYSYFSRAGPIPVTGRVYSSTNDIFISPSSPPWLSTNNANAVSSAKQAEIVAVRR